jgi:hypothetical protein
MRRPYWTSSVNINNKEYNARPWGTDRRTDVYGNNRACSCSDLMRVDKFCVCIGRAYCKKHGGPRCVGGHD